VAASQKQNPARVKRVMFIARYSARRLLG
jgi:hypothetical protein